MRKLSVLLLLLSSVFIVSCDKDEDDNKDDFDRSVMLENIGDNVIVPNYASMESELQSLESAFNDFEANTNSANLTALKTAFESSYEQWQHCTTFDFGPAMSVALRSSMNTYPTDTAKIIDNVEQADYNLETVDKIDAIGLPAVDFLLYAHDEIETLNDFTVNAYAAERMNYLSAIITKMKQDVSSVHSEWNSSYLAEFKEATGKDVGSSTGLLVNEMNRDFELIKHAEVGIPLGKQTLDISRPTYVQAYFSGISETLTLAHIESIRNIFNGDGQGNQGVGFDDYLLALATEDGEGNLLSTTINDQLQLITTKATDISMSFSEAVDQETSKMNDLYETIQRTVVYLKTDLPSAIGVSITYQDNDGD